MLRATVYIANMDDYAVMNEVYAEFFPSSPPAQSTVAVSRLALGALLEIEAIAVAD